MGENLERSLERRTFSEGRSNNLERWNARRKNASETLTPYAFQRNAEAERTVVFRPSVPSFRSIPFLGLERGTLGHSERGIA
jgi:hypothetical protein